MELLNFARSFRLKMVVPPRYMAQVFVWLYKGGSLDVCQFLIQRNVFNNDFDSYEKDTITEKTDPASMDVTLLHKLIKKTCFIQPDPKHPVNKRQENALKHVLFEVKAIRNKVCHKNPEKLTQVTDYDLDDLGKDLTHLLTKMLTLAGEVGGQDESVIAKVIANMKADVAAERCAEDGITVEEFVSFGRQELLQKWHAPKCSYVEPRLVVETPDATFGSVIPLSELFSRTFRDGSKPQVIQVTGEAGAGKTSLCKALMAWWLREEPRAQAITDYQLVLCVDCARVNSSDLHRHLCTWTLPKTTALCDGAGLTRILRKAKVLWLVDGWDEATREARCLLEELFQMKTKYHAVLVTCRPELSPSLADHFFREKVLKVSFAGLQDDERKKLITGMNLHSFENKSLEMFLNHLRSFTIEEQQDLNNPLKLQLMAQLWCADQEVAAGRRSLSLGHIYHYMIQQQRYDLIARCRADAAPGQDVEWRIDAWLRRLYEVSFNSVKSYPSLILDEKNVKSLLKECGVRATLCLSTFLGCTSEALPPSCSPTHAFSHNSQRCAYAARHLECCCEDAADAEAKLREVLEADSSELDDHVDPYLGVYDLVTQVLLVVRVLLSRVTFGWICQESSEKDFHEAVSCLVRKCVHLFKGVHLAADRWLQVSSSKSRLVPVLLQVMEMWAEGLLQASISAKCLVDMYSDLLERDEDPGRWLEVVRRCGTNGDLVKEVSRKINAKLWVINDGNVRAAVVLLRYITPAEATVVVSGDPNKLPHLPDLLSQLAEGSVPLNLNIRSHFHFLGLKDISDPYLALICRHKSKCYLTAFTGHLSAHGLLTLAAAWHLTDLSLRITQIGSVHELTALTPRLSCLKSLKLVYDLKKFVLPHSSTHGSLGVVDNGIKSIPWLNGRRAMDVHLQLPHLRPTSVNSAVDFISGLSKRYVILSAGKLDHSGVKRLVVGLKNNSVTVGDLMIIVYVKEYKRDFLFGLGSLPFQVPLGAVLSHLHKFFKNPIRYMVVMRS